MKISSVLKVSALAAVLVLGAGYYLLRTLDGPARDMCRKALNDEDAVMLMEVKCWEHIDVDQTGPKTGNNFLMILLSADRTQIDLEAFPPVIAKTKSMVTKNRDGNTALHLDSSRDYVATLIQKGADPNAKNNSGQNAVMYWQSKKQLRDAQGGFIPDLIKKGWNLNDVNADGDTLLHLIARNPWKDFSEAMMAYKMVKAGANLQIRNKQGLTAAEEAKKSNWPGIKSLEATPD